MDRFKHSDLFADATLLPYLQDQQKWVNGITAEACYDPALRSFRDFLDPVVAASALIAEGGGSVEAMSIGDLKAARDALTDALAEYDRMNAALLLAIGKCT